MNAAAVLALASMFAGGHETVTGHNLTYSPRARNRTKQSTPHASSREKARRLRQLQRGVIRL